MQRSRVDEGRAVAGVANRPRRCPFQCEHDERLVAEATSAVDDALERRIHRLDDAEAHGMVAVGGDAVDVYQQEPAEPLRLRQPLPAQRLHPTEEDIADARPVLNPQPIELLAEDVGFEEPAIGGEQLLQLHASSPESSPNGGRSAAVEPIGATRDEHAVDMSLANQVLSNNDWATASAIVQNNDDLTSAVILNLTGPFASFQDEVTAYLKGFGVWGSRSQGRMGGRRLHADAGQFEGRIWPKVKDFDERVPHEPNQAFRP
jgi:hypothetical protein